ncbi:MAG: response regulator transcription factor [Elusimicrobia bacterium]|nr:response regulator transcription factor [Elusimicrobiota bacterium]
MARILSIEDDPDLQQLFSFALQKEGYQVHYAFTGKEGYEKALQFNPDLILLDMMLPILSGVEVLKLLMKNKTTREIPVIVMTGYPQDANFVESAIRSMGVIEYVRKPVRISDMVSLIRRTLEVKAPRTDPDLTLVRGDVRIDPKYRSVWVSDNLVAILPGKRFEVLFYLFQRRGEVSWQDLAKAVWGKDGTKNDVEKAVQRLREDLGPEHAARVATTENGYQLMGSDPDIGGPDIGPE